MHLYLDIFFDAYRHLDMYIVFNSMLCSAYDVICNILELYG
jgi:hypothetical protein